MRHSVQTLRHYPKTASGWNQYIRDNVARKRFARALGLVLPASDENLMAIVIGERGERKGRIFSKLAQTQARSKIYTHRANPLSGFVNRDPTLRVTSNMNRANLIEDITERADAGNWCKRLYCTTRAARDLRAAFAAHSSEEIVDGLKTLSHDFISDNFDIFLFAAVSASEYSSPENTLHMLGAAPASGYLQGAIEHHAAGMERSRRYDEQNSPEALRALRVAKKAKQLRASQPHRDLKNIEKDMKKQLIEKLNSLPKPSLIEVIFKSDFENPKRVVGGMVFAKIREQIHKGQVSEGDENAIRVLAIEHGGHWKKLESLLVHATKNSRTLT